MGGGLGVGAASSYLVGSAATYLVGEAAIYLVGGWIKWE